MHKTLKVALAAGVSAAALAAPSAANAATFCVNAPNCPAGGIDKNGDLGLALAGAAAAGGSNTVLVGDKGSPYVGPFTTGKASTPGLVAGSLTIKGDGPGRPVLTAGAGDTVLSLRNSALEGIDVRQESSADGTGVLLNNSSLKDVTVSAAGDSDGGGNIDAIGDDSLVDVRIASHGDSSLGVGVADVPGHVEARNVTIQDTIEGPEVSTGSTLSLTGSHVTVRSGAVRVHAGGSAVVGSTVLSTSNPEGTGVEATSAALSLDHVTIAQTGPGDPSRSAGLALDATQGGARANLSAVAIVGYPRSITRVGASPRTYTITAQDSVWDSSADTAGGAAPPIETNDVHVAPLLVDLAHGDLRPRAASAQVDIDGGTTATYRDADGHAAVDGDGNGSALADAGALEYGHRAPSVDSAQAPVDGVAGQPLDFAATASDPDADAVQVTWQFDDNASASTAATTHAFATAGSHTAVVTATDETGLRATRTLTVNVVSPAAGGTPPPIPTPSPSGPSGDLIAPKLTSVSLSSKKTRVTKARALSLRLRVSEAATIRIVPRRLVKGHVVAARGALVKRVGAGRSTIKLAGQLKKLKLLSRGRLSFVVTATDAAGNTSSRKLLRLVLR